jgi:AP-3 complex subunit beta
MIVDMDEWGQLAVIRLFTIYSRKCFPKRTTRVKRAATQEQRAKDFYEDLEPQEETEEDYEEEDSEYETESEEDERAGLVKS